MFDLAYLFNILRGIFVIYLLIFIHYGIKFFKKAIAWLDTH